MASSKADPSSTVSRNSDPTLRRSQSETSSIPEPGHNARTDNCDGLGGGDNLDDCKDFNQSGNGGIHHQSPSPVVAENSLPNDNITSARIFSALFNDDVDVFPNLTAQGSSSLNGQKTVDDMWREIVIGKSAPKECKAGAPEEMMTLEDFLAKTVAAEEDECQMPPVETLSGGLLAFDAIPPSPYQSQQSEGSVTESGNGVEVIGGTRKRRAVMEPLDRAGQQRQRRMIKNRESAARSRERKQAYEHELESLAARLEEDNERLLKEKAARTKERCQQLMEKLVPVGEKRKPAAPARAMRRTCSLQW